MIAFAWILFLVLLIVGLPVAFTLGGSSVIMLLIEGTNTNIAITQKIVMGLDSFTLLTIPFFMLAGALMIETDVGDKIFDFAGTLVRHLPGGLAQVNVVASVITAGMSGTAVNDIVSLGPIKIRAMEKAGFDRPFSGAISAASSSIGPIIPPSVPLVLIGSIMGVSISKMLLAGIIPGLVMAGGLMVYTVFVSKKRKYPQLPKASFSERLSALIKAIPALLMPVILMSGFMTGFVTPTESAALAVIYAIFLGFIFYRNVKFVKFWKCLADTAQLCSTTMLIISCASVFGLVITQQQIPQVLSSALLAMTNNYYIIVLIIVAIILVLGMLMETTAIMIIMTPILMVIAQGIGMDLVQFGVLEALVVTTGLYTPPVGVGMFLTCKVCQIQAQSFLREIWPMIIILLAAALIVAFVPQVSLWLPNLVVK